MHNFEVADRDDLESVMQVLRRMMEDAVINHKPITIEVHQQGAINILPFVPASASLGRHDLETK